MTIPQLTDAQRLAAGKMRARQMGLSDAGWDNLLQSEQQHHINCATNIVLAAINTDDGKVIMTKFHLDRYPPPVSPVKGDGTDAQGRIGIDARRVTALEFMIHHIQLAVSYYEAPADECLVLREAERILDDGLRDGLEIAATRALLAAMNEYYANLKREQDDADED